MCCIRFSHLHVNCFALFIASALKTQFHYKIATKKRERKQRRKANKRLVFSFNKKRSIREKNMKQLMLAMWIVQTFKRHMQSNKMIDMFSMRKCEYRFMETKKNFKHTCDGFFCFIFRNKFPTNSLKSDIII